LSRDAWFKLDWNALDDFDAETLQCGHVRGVVGEQANFAQAEIGENLAAETDSTEDALRVAGTAGAITSVRTAAVEGEAAGNVGDSCENVTLDAEAALGVVQVDEGAAAGCGDLAK
jgi:hypothetical protein